MSGQRRNLHVLVNDERQGGSQISRSTLEIIVAPEHAVVDDFGVHNSHVHYRAAGSYVGQDSFTYQICNVVGLCDTATVTITVASDSALPEVCVGFDDSTIEVSFDEDRRDGWGLDGSGFVGPDTELYIFATVPETTTAVWFYVDDRTREDPPANIDTSCAYDLLSATGGGPAERGITMSELGNGFHTITIVVVDADNSETVRHADFGVLVLGQSPSPTPTATPAPTPTPVPAPTATPAPTPTPAPSPTPQGIGSDCAAAQAGELDLAGADLGNCDLAGLDLSDAELAGAKLQGANLAGVNLSGVNLTGAQVQGANFENANLSFADLDEAHLQGANFANANGTGAQLAKASLQGTNLAGANFTGAKFDEAKLQNADLSGGNFSGAQLIKVNLNDANLSGADLRGTNFKEAKLHRADITGALIEDTSFDQAELNEANLLGAIGTPLADGADATFAQTICPDGAITSIVSCWD